MIKQPISVYINWASYDELSDNVELTEELAMRQLDELLRLRRHGMRLDYYVMDCFWYAKNGGYRTWRKPHWPNGPDAWLNKCLENNVKPGLWLATDALFTIDPIPEWEDSVDASRGMLSFAYGPYREHLFETMHRWYERGVRMYKFDFANFNGAPKKFYESLLPSEIRSANISAFQGAMKAFRRSHPEVVMLAYNGFDDVTVINNTIIPLRKAIDQRWLEVFDSIYCGDPRLADVPSASFWRAKDVYSDHMVRYFEFNGIPLPRIDNSGFMIGKTGTCYYRGTAAWKGMLLLSLARGGWVNTYYGNLELLDESDARFFAKAQQMFLPLQASGIFSTFGAMPGSGEAYGFEAKSDAGALVTIVNPSQKVIHVAAPLGNNARLLFQDAGFAPKIDAAGIVLGPEQMAVVGTGVFADEQFDLGVQSDVVIPSAIQQMETKFETSSPKEISTTLTPPTKGILRIIVKQLDANDRPKRSTGGAPPKGKPLGEFFQISADQQGRSVPVSINYNKPIWSGMSSAVGEIDCSALSNGISLHIRCITTEPTEAHLQAEIHHTTFA